MKILSFDSTAKVASVAVCEDGHILSSFTVDNGLTQSELLLPMAESMLKCLGIDFEDIELLASSVGPGSFTGVRIGTALVKGIAFGRNIPCVSVSTLEALAENLAGIKGIIVAVMDARRDQVYRAIFESDGKSVVRLTPDAAVSTERLASELSSIKNTIIYLVGDGGEVCRRSPYFSPLTPWLANTPPLVSKQNAASVCAVAYRKYLAGHRESDREHMPTYLRMPQAERERLEREKLNKKQ